MLKGVDLSHYQVVNWSVLKNNTDFVIIKASEGTGYEDPAFLANQDQARANEIPLGYYHFGRPDLGNTPEAEAEYFKKIIGDIRDGEFLCLDYEKNYSDPVGWSKKFLDHLSSLLEGYKPIIYLNLSLVNSHDWSSIIDANYALWLAHYDGNTDQVDTVPWTVVAFKQYTSTGNASGISGNVDMDVFYGNLTALDMYGYKNPVVPIPSPEPDPCVITDDTDINIGTDANGYNWGTLNVNNIRINLGNQEAKISLLTEQLTQCQNTPAPTPPDPCFTPETQLGKLLYDLSKQIG